jgi:sugar-specific transcriptional regulator TrmB
MFEKYLQEIGLSDKEASVYLNLLSSGHSSAAEISRTTNIKRPTVYTILESLSKKGLASETTQGNKTRYQAEPPERLETFVERQKNLLEEKSKTLHSVIPELKIMQRESSDKPIVKYYEGKEGVLSSLEELFNAKEKSEESIYFIYPKDKVDEIWTEKDRVAYKNKRMTVGLKSKTVYTWPQSQIGDTSDGSERFKIDQEKYPLKADIAIYGDKVKIHTLTERLSGIFIQNRDVADTLKSLINYILDHK